MSIRLSRFPVPCALSTAIAVVAWLALSTASGLAYDIGPASSLTAPPVATPGVPFTVTATFIGTNGVPDSGLPVVWSSSSFTTAAAPVRGGAVLMAYARQPVLFRVCVATFNLPTGTTNAMGVVSTTVTIPAGCFGTFTLTATIPGVGSVTVTVSTTGAAGSFPNTSSQGVARLGTGVLVGTAALVVIVGSLLLLSLLVMWLRARTRRTPA
jgi:hypothetical protein